MPRWQRAAVLACAAVIGAAFAYAACDWGRWPRVTYLPLTGELTLAPPPGVVAITYPGVVLWGLGGAAAGVVLGGALCAARPRPWSTRAIHLLGAWAATAVLLAGSYYTWSLWPW